MPDISFLQINDIHVSDRPPRYRTDSYSDDIFAKIRFSLQLAKENQCDFVLCTGDLFHFPQASKVSHGLVNRWMETLDEASCQCLIVPGNHDLAAGRVESLERQPLGTLGKHKSVTIMRDGEVHEFGGHQVVGCAWNYAINADYIRSVVPRLVDILALHAPITPKANPFFATIQREDLARIARVISYGHIHQPELPVIVESTMFVNPGALSRRSLGSSLLEASDDERTPQVALVKYPSCIVEYLPLKCRPAVDVYRVDLHDARAQSNDSIQAFVKNLKEVSLVGTTPEALVIQAQALATDLRLHPLLMDLIMGVS